MLCACTGVDAGTPVAARVLAESAAGEADQRTRGVAASPGALTPARMASPAIAKTPGTGLARAAQACQQPNNLSHGCSPAFLLLRPFLEEPAVKDWAEPVLLLSGGKDTSSARSLEPV